MGATILGDIIYISKDLDKKLTRGERRIVYAHELGHYIHKDRLLLTCVILLFFWCPAIINRFKRWCEIRADRYAIDNTRDLVSFRTLMDKLEHNNTDHLTKEQRLKMAEKYERMLCLKYGN